MSNQPAPGGEAPGSAALLVIDVQKELFEKSTPVYQADDLLERINALVQRAHAQGAAVFYIQHATKSYLVEGSEGWQLHPALSPLPGDGRIVKRHGSAFQETPLTEELAARGVRKVVLTGLVTHGCVKATCLGALDLGYQVVLVRDGHSSYSKNAAKLIEQWNAKLAEAGAELRAAEEVRF